MSRHSQNRNLSLCYDPYYQGLPVQVSSGPLVEEYLERLKHVINLSLGQYRRVFAFRVDLRFPVGQHERYLESNHVLERFFASFKAKINHNRMRAREANQYTHDSSVRYVWCREFGQHGIPHYHLAILLNNDAYCTLGQYEMGRENIFNRLNEAWASALGVPLEMVKGLVEIPKNPYYLLLRNDPQSVVEFFCRTSYLCKAETKYYRNGVHNFGTSRT